MKKIIAWLLALVMVLSLAACGAQPTTPDVVEPDTSRIFTDSVGREVEVPAKIDRIAASGPLAQIMLFALCPDMLAGVASAWSADAEQYLDAAYYNLPELGQLYGGKGELNLETLLNSGAQVVIDVGEPKGSVAEDLDALQEQTGIPFIHITAGIETFGEAYRMLGELLAMPDEAETLAAYCEDIYTRTCAIAESVDKVNALYITGDEGQNVIARDSYHSEIIDLLTNNLAVVDEPSAKGTGNEVSMEQIMTWDPDYIIFAPGSVYDTVAEDTVWQSLHAIREGNYCEVPEGPYNWMGFPPGVQRYLGMMWLSKVLYPDAAADYDLYADVAEYYQLFYHCELTEAQYDALVAHSLGQ